MTRLRIASMNLILHGINSPNFRYTDTLSKSCNEGKQYDLILANMPFKGVFSNWFWRIADLLSKTQILVPLVVRAVFHANKISRSFTRVGRSWRRFGWLRRSHRLVDANGFYFTRVSFKPQSFWEGKSGSVIQPHTLAVNRPLPARDHSPVRGSNQSVL
jgi:hypothetical protein